MGTNILPDFDAFQLPPEPFDAADAPDTLQAEEPQALGVDLFFDFITGTFTHTPNNWVHLTNELQALHQWITVALITPRGLGRNIIYPESFGSDLHELIGSGFTSELGSEVPAMIEDALLIHDRIESVRNMELEMDNEGLLMITFDVVLDDDAILSFQASLPFRT